MAVRRFNVQNIYRKQKIYRHRQNIQEVNSINFMMHRSKMKDQVLVIKTNGKYYYTGREERCYGYIQTIRYTSPNMKEYDKYESKISSPRGGKRTRCKQKVVSSWSTLKLGKGKVSVPYCSKKRISYASASQGKHVLS